MNNNSEINFHDEKFDDEFEEWEAFSALHAKEDYPGLVKFCEHRFNKYPDDQYSQYYLGAAYVLNGQYEKAINFMSKYHREFPENIDFQHVILDALFLSGKDENDFNWTEKPVIFRMSNEILDICYKFLKTKKKSRTIDDLYFKFQIKGYLLFSVEDLLKKLLKDNRFTISKAEDGIFAEVRVTSKK